MNKINVPEIFQYSWNCIKFIYNFPDCNEKIIEDMVFDENLSKPSQNLINPEDYISLVENKNRISQYDIQNIWRKYSQALNPYERIVNMSLNKNIISRAYYKLYEILNIYDIKDFKRSLHLCEAPGGFVKAALSINKDLEWYAQTLYSESNIKIDKDLSKERWVKNGDGNLYNLNNIEYLKDNIEKVDLVTGDGGFDVSFNPNNQEQLSFKLIYCEFITSLICLNIGGSFVCKIFDTFTKPTVQLIYIMKLYYDKVSIIKPRSSRYVNGEKYVVCKNFKGIDENDLFILKNKIKNWNNNLYCRDMKISLKKVYKSIKNYNIFICKNQNWYIDKSLKLCKINSLNYIRLLQVPQNKKANLYCMAFNLIDKKNCSHKKKIEYGEKILKCNDCLEEFLIF